MRDLQKLGGVAALVQALAYAIGFAGLLTLFTEYFIDDELDAAGRVVFVGDHLAVMQAWYLVLYVVFGVALVILAVALHERLKGGAPAMMQIATVFGLIWAGLVIASGMISVVGMGAVTDLYGSDPALAATVWQAIEIVANGIGGGVEIVGGLWLLLISWSALRAGALSRALNYVGIVGGGAGIVTVVPVLADLGAIFGVGQLVWFVWLGVHLLRHGYDGGTRA
ncbi:MAG: DUF4386 family protein [Gemmatimonadota bacterium]